jgi:hypothetical protein
MLPVHVCQGWFGADWTTFDAETEMSEREVELKRGGKEKLIAFNARIKDDKGKDLGWTPLASLAMPTQPFKVHP